MLPQPSLDNCSRALSTGKHVAYRVHAENFRVYICKRGLDSHKVLGNRLLNMLAESGYLREALATSDKLAFPENLLWNTLISKYINCEDPVDALALYHRGLKKHASFHLSERNFVAFLKVCAKNRDLEWGLEIHGEIARLCMNIDVFMGSTLVHLYISCGSLSKAHQVLVALPVRNVVSWNALMAGYAKFGYGEQVLGCFDQMLHERITPDSVSFLCALKACGICGTLERGRELHAEIERKSILVEDAAVGNTLVDMYVKCGSMAGAQDVFDRLPTRNVVTWTNLIAGLAEHGDGKTASMCFEHMQAEGISPDAIAVACGLKACGLKEMEDNVDEDVDDGRDVQLSNSTSFDLSEETDITSVSLDKAKQTSKAPSYCNPTSQTAEVSEYLRRKGVLNDPKFMHAQETFSTGTTYCGIDKSVLCSIDISGRPKNLIVGNTLLDMYAKRGLIRKAQKVFDSLAIQDQVSWNILISGYAEHGHGHEALKRYEQMRQCGFHSGIISYVSVLKACGTIGALEDGLKIHSDITKKGFLESDLLIGSSLVDMYAKCCTLEMARQVFDMLPVQNVVSWTSLMDGYTRHGYGEEAIKLFDKMQPKGIFPDVATVVSLLKACINIGDTHKGLEIHAEIERRGFFERDLAIGNTLVDMYAKCGSLSKAHGLFNSLPLHDVISWNSLIAGYAGLGCFEKALEWLEQMQIEGVSPDAVTYAWSLKACNKTGTLLESEIIFTGIKRTQSPKGYVSAGFVRQGPLTTAQEGLYMS